MESKKKLCPRCQKNPAVIHPNFGVLLCTSCSKDDENERQVQNPEFYTISKQERIQRQRDEFKGDLAQPFADGKPNPVFTRTYPDKLNDFYTPEEVKQITKG